MAEQSSHRPNMYLTSPLIGLFAKTATPIVLVMAVNGLFTVVDAYFLGIFVGADALSAVTLMFPVFMLLIALSTLVSNGFSSVLARRLGAGKIGDAGKAFTNAFSLSVVVCLTLIILFLLGGVPFITWLSNGTPVLAAMGYTYMSLMIFFSPVVFILAINLDALRCEGKIGFMTLITLLSSILNIPFNFILIVWLEFGVAGSAYGSVLAQSCALGAILFWRARGLSSLRMSLLFDELPFREWKEFLFLGAPTSLSYVGISLTSGTIIYCLQVWGAENYAATVGAYGIVTRLMTFTFLPLLGLSMAVQAIVGNNYGGNRMERVRGSMKLAVLLAFIYCITIESIFMVSAGTISTLFVDDVLIASETGRILPWVALSLFIFGPLLMISTYFQAIGDAGRAAILSLSRTYAFGLPLTFSLPFLFGERGIWYAGPTAEFLVLILTLFVLFRTFRHRSLS